MILLGLTVRIIVIPTFSGDMDHFSQRRRFNNISRHFGNKIDMTKKQEARTLCPCLLLIAMKQLQVLYCRGESDDFAPLFEK